MGHFGASRGEVLLLERLMCKWPRTNKIKDYRYNTTAPHDPPMGSHLKEGCVLCADGGVYVSEPSSVL